MVSGLREERVRKCCREVVGCVVWSVVVVEEEDGSGLGGGTDWKTRWESVHGDCRVAYVKFSSMEVTREEIVAVEASREAPGVGMR